MSLPASHTKRDKLARQHAATIADAFDDESSDAVQAATDSVPKHERDGILTSAAKLAIAAAIISVISGNKDRWTDTLTSVYKDAAATASQGIMDSLPADFPLPDGFQAINDNWPAAFNEQAEQLMAWAKGDAESITNTTGDRISSLVDGLPEDATIQDVKQAVSDAYDTWQGAQDGGDPNACRASDIAGDTVTAGWGYGESETVGALLGAVDGADGEQTWNTVGDSKVRPTHVDADGQTAAPGDTFSVGADELRYPCDPDGSPEETANCRCYLTSSITYTPMDDTSAKAAHLQRLARRHRRDIYHAFIARTIY